MNTATKRIPMLKLSRYRDYVIIHEDLEFVFHKRELEKIKDMHNSGDWITDIAKQIKRNEYEVLLALIHLHRKRELTRPIAFRRGTNAE